MQDEKRALREEARRIRMAIPAEARAAKEARIAERFLELPELRGAAGVACYVGIKSEVSTSTILRGLLARGVLVAVPTLTPLSMSAGGETKAWQMRFARLDHPWALKPGPFGIPEPNQPWTEVADDQIDLVVVPGLRFGRDGSRLGSGGGHYDRFLARHPGARRVGIAFSEQVVEALPREPHDAGVDALVTDAETLRFPRIG